MTSPETITPGTPKTRAERRRRSQPGNGWRKALVQLSHRQAALWWWMQAMREYPLGLVHMTQAARMAGVSKSRMADLIAEGRVRVVSGMPGSKRGERWVIVEDLFALPGRTFCGKPGAPNQPKTPRFPA